MKQYGLTEGEDFNPLKSLRVQTEGNREVQREVDDYQLTIETEKLGKFDVWPNMIQKDNLLKALHISRDALLRDLELRETNKKSAVLTGTSA